MVANFANPLILINRGDFELCGKINDHLATLTEGTVCTVIVPTYAYTVYIAGMINLEIHFHGVFRGSVRGREY
jgi:hypothetical protein